MLRLTQIKDQYPESLHKFDKFILREYIQYQILRIIFDSKYASNLSFLGGTALRIVYDNQRFSEDLDFDFFNLTTEQFEELIQVVSVKLSSMGYQVEVRNVFKGAYRCYIRFPNILFHEGLSGHSEEKILIQMDAAAHGFDYKPDLKTLAKFDVFTQIPVTPLDILLAQKIYTIFNRKPSKGRDFFDTIFLFSKTQPNQEYLKVKLRFTNQKEAKEKLLELSNAFEYQDLAKDVERFLFNPQDKLRILNFKKYIEDLWKTT